jgi:hypothetical protein
MYWFYGVQSCLFLQQFCFEVQHRRCAHFNFFTRLHPMEKASGTYFVLPTTSSNLFSTQSKQHLDAFQRHKQLISVYDAQIAHSVAPVSELDILKNNHLFLRDSVESDLTWDQRVARRYYDKLYKEYTLGDLSRHKTGQVAMRWRTKQEVVSGKGFLQDLSRPICVWGS